MLLANRLAGNVRVLRRYALSLRLVTSLTLQNAIDPLNEVSSLCNSRSLTNLLVRYGVKFPLLKILLWAFFIVEAQKSHADLLIVPVDRHVHSLIIVYWSVQILVAQVVAIYVHRWRLLLLVDVVVDRILEAPEAKPPVKNCPAILFITLAKPWILVQLGQDLIQAWDRGFLWKQLQLLLDRLLSKDFIFLELLHQTTVIRRWL